MSWILLAALIAAMLGGGAVGLGYAADGAVPGDALYGLDTAMESIQYELTLDGEAKVRRALAFAEERLVELRELASEGAPEERTQLAIHGYRQNLSQAAEALAAAEASGEEVARAGSLKALLEEALSIHTQALIEVREQVPAQARSAIDHAIGVSGTRLMVTEGRFSEAVRGEKPELPAAIKCLPEADASRIDLPTCEQGQPPVDLPGRFAHPEGVP